MMSEEDKKLAIEAKGCHDCPSWHQHCHAECCRLIFLSNTHPDELNKPGTYITFKGPFSPSMVHYYKLHDIDYVHDLLRVRRDRCRVIGRQVIHIHDCSLLEGNMCKGHPDRKPLICKELTENSAATAGPRGIVLTANCLFKYKLLEVEKNVEE